MPEQPSPTKQPLTLRDLHPEWTDAQCKEAEETFDRYADLVLRIAIRVSSDPAEYARFQALTASSPRSYDDSGGTVGAADPA